jgi:hypothetical protein
MKLDGYLESSLYRYIYSFIYVVNYLPKKLSHIPDVSELHSHRHEILKSPVWMTLYYIVNYKNQTFILHLFFFFCCI